ncbi:hypothetical protein OC523_022375 [Vibrio vulnificus]|uniref:hypothetical protein n=1 Tax=Vibrio vulnificus TaxID=672 RepID=UPI0013EEADDF|nr:hypothetical protein [Vibrio vulnificus]EIO4104648.1 hypothetical protein [Vibrio vulnificus]EKG2504667.1 hypothetical protein [Vibrio vulnificus]ELH4808705.1 hypothetical protein [Vibrio vulnificus]MCU8458595.1 hypothetical protein [Vibrio vulnificus]MCU8551136.1 hypothetical protein [Vibrio vulnificus]
MKEGYRLNLAQLIVKETMTNLSASTKQLPWIPDHAPSSLSGMTLKARHFHNQ